MKFLALLKYLDQKKITPEAVLELAAIMGRSPTLEQAAEVSNAFRTRGTAGLMAMVPAMLAWAKTQPETGAQPNRLCTCPHCGRFLEVTL